jgi:glycosyltransferase involved in cell wall biosynthesis
MGQRVLLLKACDWRTAIQQRKPPRDWLFPLEQTGENLWRQTCVLPPGWMKSYPRLGMRPMAWAINAWRRRMGNDRPWALAISYPHYLHLRDMLAPDHLIYYNMDDYRLYWKARRESIGRLERRVVAEADLSVFCARARADQLLDEVPTAADRLIHLPHGAPEATIAPRPQARPAVAPDDIAHLPRPLLGFVGSLEDRLDWPLVGRLADSFPGGSIVLIGREPVAAPRQVWYREYAGAVARPNVHRLGWKTQAEIGRYNASFDVCLIPYRADHDFNRVSCPTKVMDYMATSRPVVSTPVPECRLYRDLFDVAETPEGFIEAVRSVVDRGSDDGRARQRWELARSRTWEHTAATLLDEFTRRVEPGAPAGDWPVGC